MAITATYTDVAGFPVNPQAQGQFKVVTKDVRLISDAANEPGVHVLVPARLGLNKIFGVIDLHVYAGAAADIPRSVEFAPATNTLTYYANDRAALDLDAADFSQARLAVWGI